MNTLRRKMLLTACTLVALALSTQAQVILDIDVAKRGSKIGERHYGIFFEEINHAGDGGLYAELISNRSFEDNASNPDNWEKVGNNTRISLYTDKLLNETQNNALAIESILFGQKWGVRNNGYWGINVVNERTYTLSFWGKSEEGFSGTITAALETEDGTSLGQTAINVTLGKEWQQITAEITAIGNDAQGWFSLTTTKSGKFIIDMVSLFPPTYKDRPNGCRIDLAEKLEAMKPAFVRFPGGCFVEGKYENGKTNRFEWKKTIGPIEERPGHRNVNWNYNVSDGLGFHELLQLTEDLGAEPLFVVNMGMGHGWMVPYDQIEEYIDEAMDAIEYCNGDVNTEWGAKRAANGHPEPFNMRLIEIGNENYNYSSENNNDQSDHYAERYIQFYNAIKAKYPEMIIIGNVEAWSTDNPSWRNPYPVDIVDEHYYRNPTWFASQYEKYDNYDRSLPKVYVGEYAVTSDYGNTGHLRAALGEAIFMLGMENNSDVCVMNCYAPIFVNENDQKWMPDMIRFNSSESYGTPSYHVQQLFSNNVGKQNVKWIETDNAMTTGDKFGLSTWKTAATFDNVKVTTTDGTVLFTDDFSSNTENWSYSGGTWNISNGQLYQTSTSMQGAVYLCSVETGESYTIELDATKKNGAEGFLIAFNYKDANNYCWWNLGGWSNAKHGVELCVNGTKSTIVDTAGSLTTGHTYHLKIVVKGAAVQCYMDDELIHDFTLPVQRKVYVSSNIDEEEGILYVKMVNPHSDDVPVAINLENATLQSGSLILMTANDSETENTTDNQTNVYPEKTSLTDILGNTITYTAPANSLNIMRLSVTDIEAGGNAGEASEKAIEEFKSNMSSVMSRLNFLHASMTLPATTSNGASIEWSLEESTPGYVSLTQNAYSYTLNVATLPKGSTLEVATLTAQVTFTDGTTAIVEYPVHLAPDDERYGYLYCFMNSSKEITNYALGTKENLGKKFNVLLKGQEVFDTEAVARIEGGTRDAFIIRGEKPNQYLMATTDMCNAKSGIWNNYGMDLLRSTDLIHWESVTFDFRQGKKIFSDPEAITGYYNTDEEYAKINRVWAPQIIWDSSAEAYLVYYSLLSTNAGDSYDKIYYSYANEDFTTITQPRIFYDPGYSVIDADISYNPYDGLYHMYYKRESAGGNDRGIYEATSPQLVGGEWTDVAHVTNEGTAAVEGSSHIRRINEDVYNLYYMRYSEGYEYKVCETNHVGTSITSSTALLGEGAFQHGSFITLTETEYKMLESWSDLTILLNSCRGYYQGGTTSLDRAIDLADEALAHTTVEELAVSLPGAYANLLTAKNKYQDEVLDDLLERKDITILLKNPDFSAGSEGWSGTTFTAANGYIAEQYNKTFDNYQTLDNMPAGQYTLSCQGFYRYGSVNNATNAYNRDTEKLNAMLYINDKTSPLLSIFSDKTNYTIDPYTYPNNVNTANEAFNTKGTYSNNSVTFILQEPGTLTLGIKKTTSVTDDWSIFDNFKLIYEPLPEPDPLEGKAFYLQNVATGTFLMGSNSWGTRASLGQAQMDVRLEVQSEGVYAINTLISNGGDSHYLGSNGYVDATAIGWNFVNKGNNVYAITLDNKNFLGYYDGTSEVSLNLTDPNSTAAQWRLMTREELIEGLDKATSTQPIDATFLIRAANFSHNDTRRNEAWITNEKIAFGGDAENECAEVWNSSFIVYQQITDLPNGVYRLSMQGFYRVGGGGNDGAMAAEQFANGTTQLNASLHANEETLPLMSIMEEAKEGTAPDNNYYTTSYGYIPQSLTGASAFFSDGCYMHGIDVTVTDGTLLIAVTKTTQSSNDWTCFDNFRLTYYGQELTLNETDEVMPDINEDTYSKVVVNRTLKANVWNTFIVPFEMSIPEGWEVKKLDRSEKKNDNITLYFEGSDVIEAGVPYMVRVENETSTIEKEYVRVSTEQREVKTDDIQFVGVYVSGYIPEGSFFISDNKFWYAADGSNTINAFRAFLTPINQGTEARALNYRIDGEEGTTAIDKGHLTTDNEATVVAIYTLNGARIDDMQEGVNILQMNNGTTIKVVIE